MLKNRSIWLLCALILFTQVLWAKTFTNQYIQFELPIGWECNLEGTEWVCQSTNKNRKKEAIIIMAAKVRGSQDSLALYQAYLKKPKTFKIPGGQTQVSEPKYTKVSKISDHQWVDSLHLASEVPGFYTRYMATVISDLGVAVTFSVAKDYYDSYQELFDRVIQTMKVFRQKKASGSKYELSGGNKNAGDIDKIEFIDGGGIPSDIGKGRKKKAGDDLGGDEDLMLLALVLLVGGFFLMKKLKKGKKKGKKKVRKKKK